MDKAWVPAFLINLFIKCFILICFILLAPLDLKSKTNLKPSFRSPNLKFWRLKKFQKCYTKIPPDVAATPSSQHLILSHLWKAQSFQAPLRQDRDRQSSRDA